MHSQHCRSLFFVLSPWQQKKIRSKGFFFSRGPADHSISFFPHPRENEEKRGGERKNAGKNRARRKTKGRKEEKKEPDESKRLLSSGFQIIQIMKKMRGGFFLFPWKKKKILRRESLFHLHDFILPS